MIVGQSRTTTLQSHTQRISLDQRKRNDWISVCQLLGIAVGFLFALVCGLFEYWQYPDDPSVGVGAVIIGFVTVPAGFVAGAIVGRIVARMK